MVENSSSWCMIHIGCGGQLKVLQIHKKYDFRCSACDNKLMKNEDNILSFSNEPETKLPKDVTAIDILQLDREDRANLIKPKTDKENSEQKDIILEQLEDKPIFF
jgi:hypothetical protein